MTPHHRGVRSPRRASALALVSAVMLACGPQVRLEPEEAGSSSGGEPPSTTLVSTSPVPEPTTSPEPTTIGVDATTASETGPAESTDDGDGCLFLCRPDHGPPGPVCSLWAQDCPADEKCAAWSIDGSPEWSYTRCTPLFGEGWVGDPCTVEGSPYSGIDDCGIGAMCWNVDPDTNAGECVELCSGDPAAPVCPDGQECLLFSVLPVPLCLDACHPLLGDCPAGQGCYPTGYGEAFACHDVGAPGAYPQPCGGMFDCDPGSLCIEAAAVPDCAGEYCCTAWCDTTSGEPCPGAEDGVTCYTIWPPDDVAPPGLENVGVCLGL